MEDGSADIKCIFNIDVSIALLFYVIGKCSQSSVAPTRIANQFLWSKTLVLLFFRKRCKGGKYDIYKCM